MHLFLIPNRLKRVVGKVIFYSKNAFVERREILDASLIVNEATVSLLKTDGCRILCDLDIRKHMIMSIRVSFSILKRMDFGEQWIN